MVTGDDNMQREIYDAFLEYAEALKNNPSAIVWEKEDFVYDVLEWAKYNYGNK